MCDRFKQRKCHLSHGENTLMYRNEPKANLSTWVAQLVEHLTC